MAERGLFVAFEGGDGSGKSTQARLLAERIDAVLTRNPGGTEFGTKLREFILDPNNANISLRAEALLFMADRAEQVDKLIEPTVASGRHVVTDRYAYSSLAYQGYGRGLDVDELKSLADWSVRDIWPDVVVFIDVPTEVGIQRRPAAQDHYESEGEELQRRVTEGFHEMAKADPDRWKVIDGLGTIEEVQDRIWVEIGGFFKA